MPRRALWVIAAVVCCFAPTVAAAQTGSWPVSASDWTTALEQSKPLERGPGFYLSFVKLALAWLAFIGWVKAVDWLNRDAKELERSTTQWNLIFVIGFAAGWALLIGAPSFWLGFPALIGGALVPVAAYVVQRNKTVGHSDALFTPAHFRYLLATNLNKVGVKMSIEAGPKKGTVAPVPLVAMGGESDIVDKANHLKAKQLPGYVPCSQIVADAEKARASSIMFDLRADGLSLRYLVDGVWRDAPGHDKLTGEAVLIVMKTLAAMRPDEVRARQRGVFGVGEGKKIIPCRLTVQGTTSGQRALLKFDDGSQRKARLPDLGMRERTLEAFQELLTRKQALILVSAPPGGGLTTLFNASVFGIDRYLRSVAGVEDSASRDLEVENVPVTTFNSAAGEGPDKVLTAVLRQYPDALAVSDLVNGETVGILCEQVLDEKRLIVAAIRARDASESLLRVLALKAPRKEFAKALTAAINVRLVRKLCSACKQSYAPGEKLLKQLGLQPGKVDVLYRPPPPPDPSLKKPPPPCPQCQGLGYFGQTGLFEFLVVDDGVRKALATESKIEPIRAAARKAGMTTLQQEGLMLVAQGITSLEELTRVLMPEKTEQPA